MASSHPDARSAAPALYSVAGQRLRVSFAPLPQGATPFVGRARELAALHTIAGRPDVRFLTLTGPGGVGKSRLAARLARERAAAFADGVAFISLATLTTPDEVLPAIVRGLGGPGVDEETAADQLRRFIGERSLLLVLDNVEHLLAVGPALASLLATCDQLEVLLTSRVRLRVAAEHEYLVPPMVVTIAPEMEETGRADAVRLFALRAAAVRPEFALTTANTTTIREICRHLDGIPLAIELAAARVTHLSPATLLARLTRPGAARLALLTGGPADQPPRLRTMRDAIAWSYDLLNEREQMLFRRCAIFEGGFPLPAARAVADLDDETTLEVVASLVAKSLIGTDCAADADSDQRYSMLETIREFALDRLAASDDEAATRERHADWCLAFAARAGPAAKGATPAIWLNRLDHDHANLLLALRWFHHQPDGLRLIHLTNALIPYWEEHCHHLVGRSWLETALALGEALPSTDRTEALTGAGTMAWYQGDYPAATRWHEQARMLARASGDKRAEALALNHLGVQALEVGDYAPAVTRFEASLAIARSVGDARTIITPIHNLAYVALLLGDPVRAQRRFVEALALEESLGLAWLRPASLNGLGHAAVALGNHHRAAALFAESFEAARARGNVGDTIDIVEGIARVGAATDQPGLAARLIGAATALRTAWTVPRSPAERSLLQPTLDALMIALGPDRLAAERAAGEAMNPVDATAAALALVSEQPVDQPATSQPTALWQGLTRRETEIAALLADGLSNREIGDRLFISPTTVARHVANISAKVGVDSRAKVAALVHRQRRS